MLANWAALAITLPDNSLLPGAGTPGGAQPDLEQPPLPPTEPQPIGTPPAKQPQLPTGSDQLKITVDQFLLEGVAQHDQDAIRPSALKDFVEQRRLEQQGSFNFAQIQALADAITRRYRQAGFIFAHAYIPQQDVIDNIVTIKVEEGALGNVNIQTQTSYNKELLLKPFVPLLQRPIHIDTLETALLLVNDYPGIEASAAFTLGQQAGQTDLLLNLSPERPYDLSLFIDNYGSKFTGQNRGRLNYALNNISGNADRIYGNLLQTASPDNGSYGEIHYQRPFYQPAYTLDLAYSHNLFEVGSHLKQFDISGSTDIVSMDLRYHYARTRKHSLLAGVNLARKWSTIKAAGLADREDELSVLDVYLQWQFSDRYYGNNRLRAGMKQGIPGFLGAMDKDDPDSSRQGDGNHSAGGNFNSLYFDLLRFQFLTNRQYLILRASGQHSDDLLTSLEQFSIGGANNVRAYAPAQYLMDSGRFLSVEWVLNAPGFSDHPVSFDNSLSWGELFQVSFFVDYASGELNKALPDESDHVDITGFGIGLQLMQENKFRLRADLATPVKAPPDAANDRDPQYWLNASYYLP